MSENGSMGSCVGYLEEMQVEPDPIMETMLIANRNNREAVGYLKRGMDQLALDRLEHATKAALMLLSDPSKTATPKSREAASRPMDLETIALPGSSKMTDSAFVLRNLFALEDVFARSNIELLVAVVVYNLAYILHVRGLSDDLPVWKQTQDLQRAVQLYQVVRKLNQTFSLETPVLEMAVLNNMGQIHYANQEYQEMNECWTKLAVLVSDLPENFGLLDVRSMRLNIHLKDRLDASKQPQKKQRSA